MRGIYALIILLIALTPPAIAAPMDTARIYYKHGEYGKALEYVQPLADQGNADAEYMLGDMYDSGRGVVPNLEAALKWYKKAADQGDSMAQYQLASMYMSGRGIKQDYSEAAKWYRQSAQQNNRSAQTALGKMYCYGQGLQSDPEEAYYWLSLAAKSGSDEADSLRSTVAEHLTNQKLSAVEDRIAAWNLSRELMHSKHHKITCYEVIYKVTTDKDGKIASVSLARVENPWNGSKETVVITIPDSFETLVRKDLSTETYEANTTLYKRYLFDSVHPERFCLLIKS